MHRGQNFTAAATLFLAAFVGAAGGLAFGISPPVTVEATRDDHGNTSLRLFSGPDHQGVATQTGRDNTAVQIQTGNGNEAQTEQRGDGNRVRIEQSGSRNRARCTQ